MSNLPTVFNSISSAETNVAVAWLVAGGVVDTFIFHSDLIFNFYTPCE